MKIVFFGLGSIGQRQAKILIRNYKFDLYAFRSGIKNTHNQLGIKELHSWVEVEKLKPDVVFITNPTSLHIDTAIKCAKLGCKLFIEKPIGKNTTGLDELLDIIKNKKLVTYLAYNLRFHPVILNLRKYLDGQKPLHTRVVCTSYFPSWRPSTDYLKQYSANVDMGGGVILDLSHELDYITYLFKEILTINGDYGRVSNITIDSEDYVDFLISTKMGPVNVHINFFSNIRQRYIQIDFEKMTVIGDIINSEIKEYEKETLKKTYKLEYDQDQDYTMQIKYFFENIKDSKMMNNLVEASDLFKKILEFKNG